MTPLKSIGFLQTKSLRFKMGESEVRGGRSQFDIKYEVSISMGNDSPSPDVVNHMIT